MKDKESERKRSIATLLLLFVWVVFKKLLRKLLKYTILFVLLILKTFKFFISWWTDGNTKEKRQQIGEAIKNGLLKMCRWIFISCMLLWKGIIWTGKHLFNGLIHLRTTLKNAGVAIYQGLIWLKNANYREMAEKQKERLREFVNEENDEENKRNEEELLKELDAKNKKSFVSKWTDKVNEYIE